MQSFMKIVTLLLLDWFGSILFNYYWLGENNEQCKLMPLFRVQWHQNSIIYGHQSTRPYPNHHIGSQAMPISKTLVVASWYFNLSIIVPPVGCNIIKPKLHNSDQLLQYYLSFTCSLSKLHHSCIKWNGIHTWYLHVQDGRRPHSPMSILRCH